MHIIGNQPTAFCFGDPNYICPFRLAYIWYEERFDISRETRNLTFSLCCQEGIVCIDNFRQTPSFLNDLLSDYTNHRNI
ncbi:Uncharacterized protein TCM_040348 [Theobroma cacao]|uniref:Uncharacterized protein n=1 Tax=Theobroma cacao TaxID=3641 RepID=A0A061GSE0_THECC|nr:Uncharacterized protein TCM_040348 [Theobroma cacao]